jgi:membrane protease YdiL (CAAX protease family)
MNHFESSFTGKNSFWRYIIMFAAVLAASNTIGAIPLFIAYFSKAASDPTIITRMAANPSDLSVLGYDPNINLLMMLIPFVAGIFAFILLVKPLNHRTFKQTINGTSSIRWNRIFVSGFVWMILSAAYLFIYKGYDPLNFSLNNSSYTLLILAGISILFIPFQAGFEEVLFRGYLMQGLAVVFRNRWLPLLMTSLLFGLMHAWNPEVKDYGFYTMMPQYMLFGLLFGLTTIFDDGIEIALGAHIANNIFLSIMVTNNSSALQTAALFEQKTIQPWLEFWGLLGASIIFLMVMKNIYKWDDLSILWKRVTGNSHPAQTL